MIITDENPKLTGPGVVVGSRAINHEPAITSTPAADHHPMQLADVLIDKFVQTALRHARLRDVGEGHWIADVVGLDGVWADASSADATFGALDAVIRDWLWLKIEDGDRDIPVMGGIDLNSI